MVGGGKRKEERGRKVPRKKEGKEAPTFLYGRFGEAAEMENRKKYSSRFLLIPFLPLCSGESSFLDGMRYMEEEEGRGEISARNINNLAPNPLPPHPPPRTSLPPSLPAAPNVLHSWARPGRSLGRSSSIHPPPSLLLLFSAGGRGECGRGGSFGNVRR